jgi:hypothetical protein
LQLEENHTNNLSKNLLSIDFQLRIKQTMGSRGTGWIQLKADEFSIATNEARSCKNMVNQESIN